MMMTKILHLIEAKVSDLSMRCDNVDLVEFELDDPTTTCGHVAPMQSLGQSPGGY